MNLLADENFPRSAIEALRKLGFDVASVADDSPGSTDEVVLARCAREKLTLLTLDKDFGERVFHRSWPAECGVILFRAESESPSEFSEIAVAALQSREDWGGMFAVVSRDRIRLRPIPKS